eukprot:CAMPEP_0197838688 /NCGR_PEP_ID=MMETSP1437-20131217/38088_1 /TAXON_ID=49252 ORGANISM="Eucampia antarctica, Strain CCMP1452" /NCGR_SAMPLE_ID=MMETSP1437 /ASSEMBLY_ACC=CAM_ASM_001096 /LENGTH=129 /DNA_ID=CAMNT_0043446927 /DNA_START=126 /DNA_END=515 /DNA_ORIENTATION=+
MTIIGLFSAALNPSAMFCFFHDKFPSEIRITSMAFSYNMASATFGGLSPAAATFLSKIDPLAPAYIITGTGVLSILGILCSYTYKPPMYSETASLNSEVDTNSESINKTLGDGPNSLSIPLLPNDNNNL